MARSFIQVIGTVSIAPQRKATSGTPLVSMSVAQQLGYAPPTGGYPPSRFLDVAIWDTVMGEAALRDLYKGAKVAIEGTYSVSEYNGKEQHSLYAYKIWPLDEMLPREERAPKVTVATTNSSEDEW